MMQTQKPQGFLAIPSFGKGLGVLVLHAWWGLIATIRAVCNRLAEVGFRPLRQIFFMVWSLIQYLPRKP